LYILFSPNNFILILSCICKLESGQTLCGIVFIKYDSYVNIFNFQVIGELSRMKYNLYDTDVKFSCPVVCNGHKLSKLTAVETQILFE
jgi:hypothetical protein